MDGPADLEQIISRLLEGTAGDADRQTLREALAAGRLSLATGAGAVAITGDVTDTVIVTGDRYFVFKGGDAAAVRQAILALYPVRLRQLPADLPDFTGRKSEVEKLLHLFLDGAGQAAILALGGMGGVGKTALAVHIAHKLAVQYPEAQIVVDLMGSSEAPLSTVAAMGQVITAFEPQARMPEHGSEVAGLYRSFLAGRRVLLLLDNAADAAQVRDLLPAPPSAAIITSRRTLVLPGVNTLNLDILSEAEAADFLRTILGADWAQEAEIAILVARCDRLPLALRAAGSFVKGHPDWTLGDYLEALAREHERLRRLKNDDLDVEAVLGLSAAALARENAEMAGRWQMLTVFPGSFERLGTATVWQVELEEARDTLGELLARSLVLYDNIKGRYRLHDLMRLVAQNAFGYGGAAPDAAADKERLARAAAHHAVHYEKILRVASSSNRKGGESIGLGLRIFDLEQENVRAGVKWATAHAKVDDTAARLCCDYRDAGIEFFLLRLQPEETLAWLEAALAAAVRLEDRTAQLMNQINLGVIYNYLGEYHRAIEVEEQALAISREIVDRNAEGKALTNLGISYNSLGEYHRAIEVEEQALAISREIGDRRMEGRALNNLGNYYRNLGEYNRSIKFCQPALAIFREIGDRQGEGNALGSLANAYSSLGEYRQAVEFCGQQLVITREIGDRRREGTALNNLGIVYKNIGDYRRAIEFQEQALAVAREIGDREGEGNALGNLGNSYLHMGQCRKAFELFSQSLAISQEIGHRQGEGSQLGNIGNYYNFLGEYRRTIEFYKQQLAITREIGYRRGEGNALGNMGNAYYSLREYRRAIDHLEQQLSIAREIGDRRVEGAVLGNLGLAYDSLGDYRREIEYCEQSLAIFRETGDRQGEVTALGNLGNAYYSLREYRRAIDHLEQQLSIAREIGDRQGEGGALFNLSLALDELGDRQRAIAKAQEALEIFEQIESPHADRVRQQQEEWLKET